MVVILALEARETLIKWQVSQSVIKSFIQSVSYSVRHSFFDLFYQSVSKMLSIKLNSTETLALCISISILDLSLMLVAYLYITIYVGNEVTTYHNLTLIRCPFILIQKVVLSIFYVFELLNYCTCAIFH